MIVSGRAALINCADQDPKDARVSVRELRLALVRTIIASATKTAGCDMNADRQTDRRDVALFAQETRAIIGASADRQLPPARCGNGTLDAECQGEPGLSCAPVGDDARACVSRVCAYVEECDDGNNDSGDGCSARCTREECGNGIADSAEECDDGNEMSNDGCSQSCTLEVCGNGRIDAGEDCDNGYVCLDSNVDCTADPNICVYPFFCQLSATDGCQHCRFTFCGDGIVQADNGEECDDGNGHDGDGCSAFCMKEACGNGRIDPDEVCDDGNTDDGDGCSSTCRVSRWCGNGIVDEGEECDEADRNNIICYAPYGEFCEYCNADCKTDKYLRGCGDGILQEGKEECDDGNTDNGDGCSSSCTIDSCGNGVIDPAPDGSIYGGEACDDGAENGEWCTPAYGENCLVCSRDCKERITVTGPRCGDGTIDAPFEECDEGPSPSANCVMCRLRTKSVSTEPSTWYNKWMR